MRSSCAALLLLCLHLCLVACTASGPAAAPAQPQHTGEKVTQLYEAALSTQTKPPDLSAHPVLILSEGYRIYAAGDSRVITHAVWEDGTVYTQRYSRDESGCYDTSTEPVYGWHHLDDQSLQSALALAQRLLLEPEPDVQRYSHCDDGVVRQPTVHLRADEAALYTGTANRMLANDDFNETDTPLVSEIIDKNLGILKEYPCSSALRTAIDMYLGCYDFNAENKHNHPASSQPVLIISFGSSYISHAVWDDGTVYKQEISSVHPRADPTYGWYQLDDEALDRVMRIAQQVESDRVKESWINTPG